MLPKRLRLSISSRTVGFCSALRPVIVWWSFPRSESMQKRAANGFVSRSRCSDERSSRGTPMLRPPRALCYAQSTVTGPSLGDLVGDPTVPASSDADLGGWSFTVTGPNPSTTVVCSGTTNSFGFLECSTGSLADLVAGNYTVTENTPLKTIAGGKASFNTDPGPLPLVTGISKTVAIGLCMNIVLSRSSWRARMCSVRRRSRHQISA